MTLNDQPGSEYNNYPIPTYIYLASKIIVLPTDNNFSSTQSTKDQYGNEQKPLSIKLLNTDKLTSAQITDAEDLINQIKF